MHKLWRRMIKYLRICLLFDELFLQKHNEYFGGEQISSDEIGELYKGIVYFMIAGLKESTHVIKSSLQRTINDAWFGDELFECLYAKIKLQLNISHSKLVCNFTKNYFPHRNFLKAFTRKFHLATFRTIIFNNTLSPEQLQLLVSYL